VTDVLAGESAGEDVDGLDGGPVHGGDVAVVRDVGPVGGEYLGRRVLDLAVPRDATPDDIVNGKV